MSPRLAFALETVHLAGRLTLGFFQTDTPVHLKDDVSPVTLADREAERLIRKQLHETYRDPAAATYAKRPRVVASSPTPLVAASNSSLTSPVARPGGRRRFFSSASSRTRRSTGTVARQPATAPITRELSFKESLQKRRPCLQRHLNIDLLLFGEVTWGPGGRHSRDMAPKQPESATNQIQIFGG
jgi:hypothetical protein